MAFGFLVLRPSAGPLGRNVLAVLARALRRYELGLIVENSL